MSYGAIKIFYIITTNYTKLFANTLSEYFKTFNIRCVIYSDIYDTLIEKCNNNPNLYLFFIGTMNTADRSIRGIDAALRRRFDVFKFNPDVDILKGFYKSGNKNEYANLFSSFEKLNNMLEDVLGSSDMLIGHSFFMEEVLTKDKLRYKWERQIKPQIEEYLYDNKTALSDFEFENIFN